VLAGLRQGPREALLVLVSATLLLMLARALTGSNAMLAVALSAGLWLPALVLTELLRRSRSLSLCLQAAVVGVAALALALFVSGDPVGQTRTLLESMRPQLERAFQVDLDAQTLARVAHGFTAALFGGTLLTLAAGVLLGRWWESLLAGPGGFAAEFRQLRMGRLLAILSAVLLLLYLLTRAAALESVLCVLGIGFALQGLAVLHSAAAAQGLHVGWLIALYVALFATALYAAAVIALVGWLDAWVDLRARLRRREPH
jgi:hypothetical protein